MLVTNNIAGYDKGNIESRCRLHVHLPKTINMGISVNYRVRHWQIEKSSHAKHQFRDQIYSIGEGMKGASNKEHARL